jgi:hypothetical protein
MRHQGETLEPVRVLKIIRKPWPLYSPFASALGFTHLPPLYWPILTLTLLRYVGLTQIIKVWLLRKHWI